MAFPVILIDSVTGSDTAASGAGPSTALTGTAGATNGGGTVVTLDAGTVLTGVLTNGSHVIWFNDTTAGGVNFTAITAKAGSGGATPTVTVSNPLTGSLSGKTWAIGGKRASLGSASSLLLVDNNSTPGDAKAGWIIEFQSGHTESVSNAFNMRCFGTYTDGPITLRGVAGASVMPIITQTVDYYLFIVRGDAFGNAFQVYQSFEVRNTDPTKSQSYVFQIGGGGPFLVRGVVANHATNFFTRFGTNLIGCEIINCEIANCVSDGIVLAENCKLQGNYIHHNGRHGIYFSGNYAPNAIANVLYANTSCGMFSDVSGGYPIGTGEVRGNTVDLNGADGYSTASGSSDYRAFGLLGINNNIFSNNGGYGINMSGLSDVTPLFAFLTRIAGNDYYNNTSGKYFPTNISTLSAPEKTVDPQYVNASAGDFTPQNTLLKGGAVPTSPAESTNYQYAGAVQPNSGGGGSTIVMPAIFGG